METEVREITPRDCVERVRETIPHVNAVDGLRACRLLARLLNTPMMDHGSVITEVLAQTPHRHQAVTAARAAHLAIPSDGTMAPHLAPPEPFTAQRHTVKLGRNKKGPTRKVIARGAATVQGATRATGYGPRLVETVLTGDDRSALVSALRNARRITCGSVALDVQRVTDRTFAPHGLPALLGTDLIVFEQVLPGDRTSRCSVAVQHAGLTGLVATTTADRLAAHGAVYSPHTGRADDMADGTGDQYRTGDTGKVADMLSRRRIAFRRRVSETARVTRTWQAGQVLPRCQVSTALCPGHLQVVTALVTGHDRTVARSDDRWSFGPTDRVFIGHVCQVRQAVQRRSVKRRTRSAAATVKRAERTIGTVDAPETVQGWRTLIEAIGAGERLVVTVPDGNQVITRGTRGKFATRGPLGQWAGIRTPDALAVRLTA